MAQAEWVSDMPTTELVHRLNAFLKPDLAIHRIFPVPDDFHARFKATFRTYHYQIARKKNPFEIDTSWYFTGPLDQEAMQAATKWLLGTHDFQAFSKVKTDVKTFFCTVTSATWIFTEDQAVFQIQANRFLRGMVRALVGTLVEVGQGKRTVASVEELLQAKDRRLAGAAAPAQGLSLVQVGYPSIPPVVRSAHLSEMPLVRTFFETYAQELGIDLGFQGFQAELDSLPVPYEAPNGDILWLEAAGERIGIVAIKKLEEGVAEMKRLFILPQYRGKGWSQCLVAAVEKKAKSLGYLTLKLDTLERLISAVALYRKMEYTETAPYNYNPEPDILYFTKQL